MKFDTTLILIIVLKNFLKVTVYHFNVDKPETLAENEN